MAEGSRELQMWLGANVSDSWSSQTPWKTLSRELKAHAGQYPSTRQKEPRTQTHLKSLFASAGVPMPEERRFAPARACAPPPESSDDDDAPVEPLALPESVLPVRFFETPVVVRARTAGGRVAIVLERKQRGWFAVELDGNANEGRGYRHFRTGRPAVKHIARASLSRAAKRTHGKQGRRRI